MAQRCGVTRGSCRGKTHPLSLCNLGGQPRKVGSILREVEKWIVLNSYMLQTELNFADVFRERIGNIKTNQ